METKSIALLMAVLAPLSAATAADYTVTAGHSTLSAPAIVPAATIKMCLDTTGYRFGYEVRTATTTPYRLKAVLHLPAAAKTVGKDIQALNYGRDLVVDEDTQSGSYRYDFSFDEGDPLGRWSIDIVVDDNIVRSVAFDVVPATVCP